MRGIRGVLGLALALTLSVAAGAPGRAEAQEACTNRVYDESGTLGPYFQPLTQLATQVSSGMRAEVFVRAVATVPGADIDGWHRTMQAQCPGWAAPNAIVLAVATQDRKTGIYYGDAWNASLDSRWQSIQETAMNPEFKRGQFGVGLINGLAQVAGAIAPQAAGTTGTTWSGPPITDAPRRDAVPKGEPFGRSSDDDGFGLPWGMFTIVAIMGLVGVVGRLIRSGGSGYGEGDDTDGDNDDDDVDRLNRRYGFRRSPGSSWNPFRGGGGGSGGGWFGGSGSGGGGSGGGGSTDWGSSSGSSGGSSGSSGSSGGSSGGGSTGW